MIDRYPHSITVKEQSGSTGPAFDGNGDPVAVVGRWSANIPCRYETDGRSNIRVEKDGALKTYAYVVFIRQYDMREDLTGRTVRLFNSDGVQVCECLVHHVEVLQLSTALYIERCL